MSIFDGLRHRLRAVLRARAVDHEREQEFAFHQELAEQEHARELDAGSARHAARREFGNATYLKEEIRQMGVLRWIDALRQDLRFGARTLRRSPVFALVAILSIGLGIGANTAIFGMIHRLLLEQLPLPRAQELMQLRRAEPHDAPSFFSPAEYQALAASNALTMSGFAGSYSDDAEINGSSPMSVSVELVEGGFFSFLSLATEVGRGLTQADYDEVRPVATVAYNFAVHHYGSAASALGQRIKLHGTPFTIVGVLPRGFQGLVLGGPFEVVVPRSTFPLFQDRAHGQEPAPLHIIARVTPGSGAAAAIENAFQRCCADSQLGDPYTGYVKGQHVILADMSRGMPEIKRDLRAQFSRAILALMTGVALLLLIACTNVGNLLLARALVRARELSVRLSLGASRGRIVRQLLVESALLASLGAVLGLVFAFWGTALLARHMPANLRSLQSFIALRPSLIILAFAAGVTITCAMLFGVLPAIRATRLDLIARLREARPTTARSRLDRAIVALQVSLALVLASAAGLLVSTLYNVGAGARVLEPDRLLMVDLDAQGTVHQNTPARQLYDQLAERIRRMPGVRSVASTSVLPFNTMGPTWARALDMPGHEAVKDEEMFTGIVTLTPGYFDAMSIALKAGRDFTVADNASAEFTAIVSESFAREFFAGRDPIGGLIRFRNDTTMPRRIIGVAEDVKYYDLRAPAPRTIYVPRTQIRERATRWSGFVVRTDGDAAGFVAPVRDVINAVLPGITIQRVMSVSEAAALGLGREQSLAWLSVAFGVLAVLLAAIGLYGVMAFQVNARKHEIGVRMALGARPGRVVRMVLRQSFIVVAIGVLGGIPLALAAGRALAAQLYGVTPWHPAPFATAAFVLIVVGMLASFLPSRAAARVDPISTMRAD
jgi:predicted permease